MCYIDGQKNKYSEYWFLNCDPQTLWGGITEVYNVGLVCLSVHFLDEVLDVVCYRAVQFSFSSTHTHIQSCVHLLVRLKAKIEPGVKVNTFGACRKRKLIICILNDSEACSTNEGEGERV
jgi:hypothetical protein